MFSWTKNEKNMSGSLVPIPILFVHCSVCAKKLVEIISLIHLAIQFCASNALLLEIKPLLFDLGFKQV